MAGNSFTVAQSTPQVATFSTSCGCAFSPRERACGRRAALVHQPLHHLDVEAEALVDGVGLPPDAGLEFEHLGLVQDEAVLRRRAAISSRYKFLVF